LQARVDFGPVTPGLESAPAVFTLRNAGDTETGAIAVRIDSDQFSFDAPTCTRLLPGGTCTVQVRYAPTWPGQPAPVGHLPDAHLSAVEGGDDNATVEIAGQPMPTGKLQIDPTNASFPSTVVGRVTSGQTFHVKNQGTTPAVVEPLAPVTWESEPTFTIVEDTCSGSTIQAGAKCELTVVAQPTTPGTHQATLFVNPIGALDSDSLAELEVEGLRPATLGAQLFTSIGSVISESIKTIDVSVGHSGGESSGPISVTLDGPDRDVFSITSDSCSNTSLPSGTQGHGCGIQLQYLPVVVGDKHATLTITATPGGSTVVPLDGGCTSGTELAPWASGHFVDSDLMDGILITSAVGATTYAGMSYGNSTPSPLSLPSVRIAGDGYGVNIDSCGNRTLASGASCTVDIRFTASSTAQAAGMLVLGSGPSLLVQALDTYSYNEPMLSSPIFGAFHGVAVGSHADMTLSLENESQVAVTPVVRIDSTVGNADQFSVVSTTCGATIAPYLQCQTVVRFTPSSADAAYGRLDTGVGGAGVTLAGWGQ